MHSSRDPVAMMAFAAAPSAENAGYANRLFASTLAGCSTRTLNTRQLGGPQQRDAVRTRNRLSVRKKDSVASSVGSGHNESVDGRSGYRSIFASLVLASLVARKNVVRNPRPRRLISAAASVTAKVAPGGDSDEYMRISRVVRRLQTAQYGLQFWSYVAEVQYTWLGIISLVIGAFSFLSHEGRMSLSLVLGLGSCALSVCCSAVGWWQARGFRTLARNCGNAAGSLRGSMEARREAQTPSSEDDASAESSPLDSVDASASAPQPAPRSFGVLPSLPSVIAVERRLRRRQNTALLGLLFAVLGLHSMVGMLVAKVLVTSGTFAPSSGVSLDVFTLLAVTNNALSHVIGAGITTLQRRCLPPIKESQDVYCGWD